MDRLYYKYFGNRSLEPDILAENIFLKCIVRNRVFCLAKKSCCFFNVLLGDKPHNLSKFLTFSCLSLQGFFKNKISLFGVRKQMKWSGKRYRIVLLFMYVNTTSLRPIESPLYFPPNSTNANCGKVKLIYINI